MISCYEGTLECVPKKQLSELNLWECDRIFFCLLEENAPFFSLKLRYEGDTLAEACLDGTDILH